MWLEARMRAFAAVARTGSFSRAAEELHVSQPAVSKHVANLEAEIGIPLLSRRPRVGLTPAGEFLAEYVLRAEALLEQARGGVTTLAGRPTGRLAFGASGTPGTYLVPRVLARFARERPEIEVEFRLGTSAEIVEAIRRHELELAVVGGLSAAPELELEPLLEDEIVLVAAPELGGRRLAPRHLGALTWVHREEGSATRLALDAELAALGIQPARRLALPSWEAVKLAVAAGGAVAACSRLAVEIELRAGSLVVLRVPGWRLGRLISVLRSPDLPPTPAAAEFLELVRAAAGGGR
jgi:DNA-binding transcriptional LysR family regulator